MPKVQTIKKDVTVNEEQRLFVIPCGNDGYSCLGFDVCFNRTQAIAAELRRDDLRPIKDHIGTLQAYGDYLAACEAAEASGKRLQCELTPQLIGLEGKRVEVVDCYGERRRFIVGKSTGFLPIHLEIARRNSSGGPGVSGAPFKTVTVIKE